MTNSEAIKKIIEMYNDENFTEESLDAIEFDEAKELAISALEENDKLKAEIEEYKNANRLWEKAYDDLVKLNKECKDENEELKLYANNIANYRNINHETATEIKFRIHREKLIEHECLKDKEYIEHLKAEIEQLKSELEQLSKQYCNVETLYHKYYNLHKKSKV